MQAILAARIDRLPPEDKDLLQTLAVIGKEFPLSVWCARSSTRNRTDELEPDARTNLQLAEFIYEQPAAGDIEYTFKHALTQEVAYNSVLIERRKALHERIGSALEALFAGHARRSRRRTGASLQPQRQTPRKAIEYLRLAAEQAAQRSSYPEAIAYVNKRA